ncbi:hypothetical protein PLESTF_000013700 [Pleodorina starrii]|nr:hypothetical protein PLESTF_000013700 [Pleodorina starrii]
MDPRKSAAVRNWPAPANLQELRKFLGLTNYFRKFISRYSITAAPLTNLTRKGAFSSADAWTPECQKAFDELKRAVADDVMLRFPDPSLSYRVEVITDASLYGTGAVLLQEGRPVAFTSKKLSGAETRYTTGEQELLAVLHALKEWRCYLEGRHFTLKTDHKPLTFLQGVPTLNRRQARWLEYMSRFDYTWEYLSGSLNVADALSRHPSLHAAILSVVTRSQARQVAFNPSAAPAPAAPAAPAPAAPVPAPAPDPEPLTIPALATCLKDATAADPYFLTPRNVADLTLSNGLWVRSRHGVRQIVVPNDADLRRTILRHYHDGALAGHPGGTRLCELVSRTFWWPRLARDAEDYVLSCDLCQRNKPQSGKTPGQLQALPIPANPWDSVSLDFVVSLPKTEGGYDAIAVFVDRLTKMAHLAPTTTACTAEHAARLFFDNVVRLHGVPKDIVSDRDTRFTSKFWGALSDLLGVKLRMSTAYHPQTDGQTERTNRTLGDMLRNYAGQEPTAWDTHLSAAEFALNNAVNRSTGRSPFFLNYGFHPALPIWRELDVNVPAAKHFAQSFVTRLTEAKASLEAAQQRTAEYYNRNKKDVSFASEQLVMLSTKNLRKLAKGPRKLLPRWTFLKLTTATLARRANLPFFGVQGGMQCWGGNDLVRATSLGSSSNCNTKCSGDSTKICGGSLASNVYSLSNDLGCFTDNATRMLPTRLYNSTDAITPQICGDRARNLGLKYYGVQAGYACFAGNDLVQATSLGPSTACVGAPCTGDGSQNCGGHWANRIYALGASFACYPKTDIAGIEIRSLLTANMDACRDECFREPTCIYSVRTAGVCYLKRNPVTGSQGGNGLNVDADSACWMRANRGNFFCIDNWDVLGDHSDSQNCQVTFTGYSLDQCAAACQASTSCQFFVRQTTGHCYLKKNPMRSGCGLTRPDPAVDKTCFRVY